MPIGSIQVYGQMVEALVPIKINSVLDIGIGMGANGVAIRNWKDSGYKPNFKTRLVGVEAFEDYRNPTWDLYDKIFVDDITKILDELPNFDAILMTDVIEHFSKEDGIKLIERLKPKANKILFISTPAIWMEQGAAYGNEYERHRSLWSAKEFSMLGFKIVDNGLMGYLGARMVVAKIVK